MKRALLFTFTLFVIASLFGCASSENASQEGKQQKKDSQQTIASDSDESNSVVYENTQYGFNFFLPDSWKEYMILTETWEGIGIEGSQSGKIVETGPLITIRHPKWTIQNPMQDIPILIFTLSQWSSLQQEDFHIGAAPIGPSELGRNTSYVFALPARYNYAFPTGYKEVEEILKNSPLQPF